VTLDSVVHVKIMENAITIQVFPSVIKENVHNVLLPQIALIDMILTVSNKVVNLVTQTLIALVPVLNHIVISNQENVMIDFMKPSVIGYGLEVR
jgi:hypothetical protein